MSVQSGARRPPRRSALGPALAGVVVEVVTAAAYRYLCRGKGRLLGYSFAGVGSGASGGGVSRARLGYPAVG